jgi:hypothetical protein
LGEARQELWAGGVLGRVLAAATARQGGDKLTPPGHRLDDRRGRPCSLRRAQGTPPHGSCCGRSSSTGFDRWKRCGKRNASDLEHRGCWGGVRCGRWRRLIGTLATFGSARERKGNQVREMGRSETDRLCSGADSRPLLFLTAGAICLCGRPAAAAASGGTGVRARGKSRSMCESAIFSGPG